MICYADIKKSPILLFIWNCVQLVIDYNLLLNNTGKTPIDGYHSFIIADCALILESITVGAINFVLLRQARREAAGLCGGHELLH